MVVVLRPLLQQKPFQSWAKLDFLHFILDAFFLIKMIDGWCCDAAVPFFCEASLLDWLVVDDGGRFESIFIPMKTRQAQPLLRQQLLPPERQRMEQQSQSSHCLSNNRTELGHHLTHDAHARFEKMRESGDDSPCCPSLGRRASQESVKKRLGKNLAT